MGTYVLIAIIIGLLIFFPIYHQRQIAKKVSIIEEQKKRTDFLLMLFDDKYGWYSIFEATKKLTNLEIYHNILVIYFEGKLKTWLSFAIGEFFVNTKAGSNYLRLAFTQAVANTSPQRMSLIVIDGFRVIDSHGDPYCTEVAIFSGAGAEHLLKIISRQPDDYKKEFKQKVTEELAGRLDNVDSQELMQKIINI